MKASSISSRILLIGGGHSHVQFLKFWSMNRVPGVEAIMVSNVVNTPYSGMLPSRLCGWYQDEQMHFNLHNLCAQAGVTFIEDRVVGLDHAHRTAQLAQHPSLIYDVGSINVGIEPTLPPGAAGNPRVMAVKPISQLLKQWQGLMEDLDEESDLPFLVAGGGAAGFELAMSLALTACQGHRRVRIQLLDSGEILKGHSAAVRRKAEKVLAQFGIELRRQAAIKKVHVNLATLSNGEEIAFERMLVTTGAAAPGWFANTDLTRAESGYLLVDDYLRVADDMFAVGDCAQFGKKGLPKAGVFAVREGPVLCENLVRSLRGQKSLRRYKPQRKFLCLLVSGHHRALLSYGPISAEGKWVWRWKNKIDTEFMARFAPMAEMDRTMDTNSCGGCGGKAPAETVAHVVQSLKSDQNASHLLPSAVEDVGYLGSSAVSVDGFRTFTSDDFFFGQVAILHALNDLFASGSTPEGVTVLVTLPPAAEKIRANRLLHLMKGVLCTLSEHNVRLINAHTSEGSDLAIAVTALGSSGQKWSKSSLRPGLALVMTKPLGTGGLLQANRSGLLAEKAMRDLYESLLQSHGPWMQKTRISIAAATDVSGFGLAGHLLEMNQALGAEIKIRSSQLLALNGFESAAKAGSASFMTKQNRNQFYKQSLGGSDLVYDPQTNGPLILAVEPREVPPLLFELSEHGFSHARHIGDVGEKAAVAAQLIFST